MEDLAYEMTLRPPSSPACGRRGDEEDAGQAALVAGALGPTNRTARFRLTSTIRAFRMSRSTSWREAYAEQARG